MADHSKRRVLIGSLAGTTIEFFDFYIYANAAVLVFPRLFFPKSDATAATLESLATFAIAFFARPLGSALFGHFGDRIGRKATLVAALLTMGISTVLIGLLPTYETIGVAAPLLLALCRVGQGLGLGGEWGGAILLATENAPPGKLAWYGMFPQLGAPIGFILSGGMFLVLSGTLSDEQFFEFGWRVPFIASTLLILVGLYVRLQITETPAFTAMLQSNARVKVPTWTVVVSHTKALVLGVLVALCVFVLFYLMTVFTQSWGTAKLGIPRTEFLRIQLFTILFFGAMIPISALWAGRIGPRRVILGVSLAIAGFGFLTGPMFGSGDKVLVTAYISLGMMLIGITYGPLGTMLAELFPPQVRYTGASLAFNLAGMFGASLAPLIAVKLASDLGLPYVGYYLSAAAMLTVLGAALTRETEWHAAGNLQAPI